MASKATSYKGRVARLTRWIIPSRHTAVGLATVEIAAFVIYLPVPLHVAAAVTIHVVLVLKYSKWNRWLSLRSQRARRPRGPSRYRPACGDHKTAMACL